MLLACTVYGAFALLAPVAPALLHLLVRPAFLSCFAQALSRCCVAGTQARAAGLPMHGCDSEAAGAAAYLSLAVGAC
jgi:hypothetical protein